MNLLPRNCHADPESSSLPSFRPARIFFTVLLVLALQLSVTSCQPDPEILAPDYRVDINGYSGTLLVSLLSTSESSNNLSSKHDYVLFNNRQRKVMEDNDIRGFLDGNFIWGWNQPGQVHVRVGRRLRGAKYGEYELFRVTYRWEPLLLPEKTIISNAKLRIFIEKPSEFPVTVYLYQINKDWNPGTGGVLNNNISPPKDGEMWWLDVAYNQQPWGLPGVNFASDTHPLSDTPEMPLAEVHYKPGDEYIEFSSSKLDKYINHSLESNSPLLFLLKLSDHHEDIPGSRITPYAGSTGDNRNIKKRPLLDFDWQAQNVIAEYRYAVDLEYGREHIFPKIEKSGEYLIATSFIDNSNSINPTIEFRSGRVGHTSDWQEVSTPVSTSADWVQFRIIAAYDPVILGQDFTAEIHDTWVTTAPPEDQQVSWYFTSPSGIKYHASADYKGDYQWSVTFTPDEIGPWNYYWESELSDKYRSDTGIFDVIIGDQVNALKQLEQFRDKLQGFQKMAHNELELHMHQFAKLERSAVRFLTPDTFDSEIGLRTRTLLNEIRAIIAESPPSDIELKPNPPFAWEKTQ